MDCYLGLVKAVKLKLQKVVGRFASSVWLNLARGWIKLKKVLLHVLSYLQYCRHVTTPITIIWGTKNCYNILILFVKIRNKENNITKMRRKKKDYSLYQEDNKLILNISTVNFSFNH